VASAKLLPRTLASQADLTTNTLIRVRIAESADTGRIGELLELLGYPTRTGDVERALSEPGVAVLVAEIGGAVVGVLVGGTRWQVHYGSTTGSIDALVIDAAYRSAGFGASLVHAFTEILERDHVPRVEVHSNGRRARAHRFYERLGFQRTSIYFVRDIPLRRASLRGEADRP
jgi:ribosomal protein S18 acetylase RimI-like enzyme